MIWTISKEGRSDSYASLALNDLSPNGRYLFSVAGNEARAHAPVWNDAMAKMPKSCIEILRQDEREIQVRVESGVIAVPLTDSSALTHLLGAQTLYIDISGLAHHVWAPLIKTALKVTQELRIVYFEPDRYKSHPSPSSTSQFDLSQGFRGVEPIPGFANLIGPPAEAKPLFVPFLGFEGSRARQVAMTLDPIPPTIPVVGLPGFRIEYPQVTLASNQEFLIENYAGRKVIFANATCPFEAYSSLVEIRRDNPGSYLYVAPLGTKPHALGAIWFAINNPQDTEIMYDHPIKMPGRTEGVGTAHIYHLPI